MIDFTMVRKLDFRMCAIILILMVLSLMAISATTGQLGTTFFTPRVKSQMQSFVLGWAVFLFFACYDYRKLRFWSWFLYFFITLSLLGLYFLPALHGVHRWYRLPVVNFYFQPSEFAKPIMVLTLSSFLEKKLHQRHSLQTFFQAMGLVMIPFVLILKQPDLGTALVLFPVALVMLYFGGVMPKVVRAVAWCACLGTAAVLTIYLGLISHADAKPLATKFIKEYQYERLNPDTYHQRAAQTAIALGGVKGKGYRKSSYTGQNWLPEAATDSIFPAFTEEFGLMGALFMLLAFSLLLYAGFRVTAVAPDPYGRLLAAGISVYLGVHIILNLGMMCSLLPITGIPLILVSYGGTSSLTAMAALGILQSIYTRRYMF
ncbi:MAG: FtsW/RodA/SpoVE family cell cycle protein [Candidatus Algichlamydia australiensis]|nr:FtsW/RodA/SpoVE family cell cycle protein [Chlamydiales bacterium]